MTFVATVLAQTLPSAPQLTGSVSGRTQALTWTGASGGGITRYQLQTRESSAHSWRFTGAGSPSPSSNMGSSARSWSVVTPWTLYRQYQVRATNAVGDGPWSNAVELRTPPAPPPPLSVPGIPNFPGLASGRTLSTVFPAATGGTPPYSYSLAGLPPGLSFVASTRVASGTLPTVTIATTYTITYAVTDSAGASVSVTFAATVVPPPPPSPVLPEIPDFPDLASGRTVNAVLFPAATGGTPPYSYSLSGLPPGLSFVASTRIASGTLPTVTTATTYTITYSVTDSAGASASETFTATVVP